MVTRAELAAQYESLPPGALWKTFVIEAHSNGDPGELLSERFGDDRVTATSDAYMHSVDGEARFVVDHLDARYWSFHTDSTVRCSGVGDWIGCGSHPSIYAQCGKTRHRCRSDRTFEVDGSFHLRNVFKISKSNFEAPPHPTSSV